MAKDWNRITSPTQEAVGNTATQAVQDMIQRLYGIRADILAEISYKNIPEVNQQLQSAMENLSLAITEIEVAVQRMKTS